MSQARRDLWPDGIDVTDITPPIAILREQAALLGERAKGWVCGEIESRTEPLEKADEYLDEAILPDELVMHFHTMYIVAPALDNYQYALLDVRHDFQAYPCYPRFHPVQEGVEISSDSGPTWMNPAIIENEGMFVRWLGTVLSRPETTRIIQALIFRVQALGDK